MRNHRRKFYNTPLWVEVASKVESAINKYTPEYEKDIKKKAFKHGHKIRKIIDYFICGYLLFSDQVEITMIKKDQALALLFHIGVLFLRYFQLMILPPGGSIQYPSKIKLMQLLTSFNRNL